MAVPDLSNLRAVVADDRPEARQILVTTLRELGVTRIESVTTGTAGPSLVTVMTGASMAQVPEPASPDQIVGVVARFTHDVTSPLTSALLLSRFLATTAAGGAQEDVQRIHAAIEEVAGMVRTLTARVAAASGPGRDGTS